MEYKTFGEMKAGDYMYLINNNPAKAKIQNCEVKIGENGNVAYITCPEMWPIGILTLPANNHVKELNPATWITSDHSYFVTRMKGELEPKIKGMKDKVAFYEDLLNG